MMQITVVANPNSPHLPRIDHAISLINGCQRFYRLRLTLNNIVATDVQVNAYTLCDTWRRQFAEDQKSILLTEATLDDNWFSHEFRSCAVITIGDWEKHYAPPSLRAYLIYQIAQAAINFAADLSEEMVINMVHEPPKGCMFDMALHKPDIKYGMVGGSICTVCSAQLRALGTPPEAIEAAQDMLEVVRREVLGMPTTLDPRAIFVVMRFTSNDENDNAWRYGIRPAAESAGFRAERGDSPIEFGQILDQVMRYIKRSRLVIAKVDEDNLNVYFELGVAMGMRKDVLLVSSEDLASRLPTNLRNWECLTYHRGNYEELKQKVEEYLKTMYG
jgi:hypothetical protein